MNLSSLVHTGRQQVQQQYQPYPSRPQHQMSSSLVANPYAAQHLPQSSYYVSAPQPPPSPPVDEAAKCSLPSISSLLSLPNSEGQAQPQQAQQAKSEYRPSSGHQQYGPSPAMSSRGTLPPTPPMQSDAGFDGRDGRQSPSTVSNSGYSVQSVASAPGQYFNPSAINNVDPYAQRQQMPAVQRRVSMPAPTAAYNQSPYSGSTYVASPQQSMSSYYQSPMAAPAQSQISGLYYQRPLPQYAPSMMPVSVSLTPSSGTNPWQHHHYISPSSASAFPQSQDRYICQTCNKAFSRPSSLRIHSHSHTGEKPFKCPHQGCGKAFSVRSNMKRHERGCHTYDGVN